MDNISNIFEEDKKPEEDVTEKLLLDIDGFDGPIDLLMNLARDQKVDLTKISILELANQYLDFIEKAREVRLELAADYLVMAAWLAYLKSRLLIPEQVEEDEPSGEAMAEALAFQLRRLEAIRSLGVKLVEQEKLGQDFFKRGNPEGLYTLSKAKHDVTLFELLKSYGNIQRRNDNNVYRVEPFKLMSMEEALERLVHMLGRIPSWQSLFTLLPTGFETSLVARSALASMLSATLEMAKQGNIHIKQEELFGDVYIKAVKEE